MTRLTDNRGSHESTIMPNIPDPQAAPRRLLDDTKVPVRIKISALWATVMFCYVYGDYFELYTPGKLQHIGEGQIGPLGQATQGVLVGTALLMAVPASMVFLSLVLKPAIARWINVVLGAFYSALMLLAIQGAWTFYQLLGVIEICLTLLVLWYAWTWPRQGGPSS